MTTFTVGVAAAAELVGSGVVSTGAVEIRASISADGEWIAWGSTDRPGGPGGWDLWLARRDGDQWKDPVPLAVDTPSNDFDPLFSADGQWLYFFSNRPGGLGGDDLYRVSFRDGTTGEAENLGPGVNTAGDEWAPTPSRDGRTLLFASDGHGGAGRHDLFQARWDGAKFADPVGLAVNTAGDEFDAAWLDDGRTLVFARAPDLEADPIRLWHARCDGDGWVDAAVWDLPLNAVDGNTLGPVADGRTVLVSGVDPEAHVGKLDIYRVDGPPIRGRRGCVP